MTHLFFGLQANTFIFEKGDIITSESTFRQLQNEHFLRVFKNMIKLLRYVILRLQLEMLVSTVYFLLVLGYTLFSFR